MCPFAALFAEPTRNGLMRPKAVRGSGVKMVNMGELFAHSRLKNVAMERVPVDQSDRSRFLLQDGDLLFARQSLVLTGAGKCSIFLGDNEPATFESHIIRVRLNQAKANPLYYYYYFQSHEGRAAIQSIVEQGAGASGIRATDLAAIDVAWCPITVQDAIAHILGTLDDKIELNRRMNSSRGSSISIRFVPRWKGGIPGYRRMLPIFFLIGWWNRSWGRYRRDGR